MNLLASLRYLVALNEHRHFARAAKACHITQPALSNAIRALEREFGFALVLRARAFVGLTPEGERVLTTAQRMLREHELLQADLASTANEPSGPLHIGVVPTAEPVAARFAATLHARHGGIAPVVRSISSSQIEQGLENLSLDLGLGFTERLKRGGPFTALAQYKERYFLVRRAARAGRSLRLGPAIGWREAAAFPLCLLTPNMHNRTIVNAAFERAGVTVRPVMETNSILTLPMSVQAGEVCSVMPGALVDAVRSNGALEALPLVQPTVTTPVGFIRLVSAAQSRAVVAALELARQPQWLRLAARHAAFDSSLE